MLLWIHYQGTLCYDNKEVVEVPVVAVIVPPPPPVPSKAEKSDMSDICDSVLVVTQAILLLLFWLLLVLLLVLSNPNCVPTPDPRKIQDCSKLCIHDWANLLLSPPV